MSEDFEDVIIGEPIKETMIDGKPITEWLFGKKPEEQPLELESTTDQLLTNNRLQTDVRPAINNKPDDVLNNITRYKNVRLHDAKRTSK